MGSMKGDRSCGPFVQYFSKHGKRRESLFLLSFALVQQPESRGRDARGIFAFICLFDLLGLEIGDFMSLQKTSFHRMLATLRQSGRAFPFDWHPALS